MVSSVRSEVVVPPDGVTFAQSDEKFLFVLEARTRIQSWYVVPSSRPVMTPSCSSPSGISAVPSASLTATSYVSLS